MPKPPWTPRALLCFFRQWSRRSASGFGLGLLVRQVFLGAKAGHSDQRFGRLCNLGLPKKLRFYLQRHKSCKKLRFLRLFAGFFMEESWFGFLIAGGLCSKPGRFLCERIKLTFAIAPGCLSPLASLGRHDRFGRLCNLGLLKTLRFSLQRHKTQEFCKAEFLDSTPVSALPCFLCQWNQRSDYRIQRKLNSGFGSRFLERHGFFDAKAPLQSWFAKDTAFFSAKAQNSRIRLAPNSRNSLPVSVLECFPAFGSRRSASGFGLGLLVSSGFFDAKAGFVEGCNLWNVLYNPEAYVW